MAIAVRRRRVPYTVALVIAGLALGTLRDAVELPHLTKELLFSVFLPGLLFEAAFHLDYSDFRRDWVAISALAIPGVIASVGLTALIVPPVLTRSLAAPSELLLRMRERYEERQRSAEADLRALHDARGDALRETSERTVRQLLAVEQDQAIEAFRNGTIDREAYHLLANDVASRIVRLERRDYDDDADLLISPAPENARAEAPSD